MNGGEGPKDDEDDIFRDLKAQYFWALRGRFETGSIFINTKIEQREVLVKELSAIDIDFTRDGKMFIVDPSKSPDYADALMLAFAPVLEAIGFYYEGQE